VALVRGTGDAYALRKAYHDEKIHNRFRPAAVESAAIFEAAEAARVEAIGALAMEGVKQNLAAQLEQRLTAKGLSRATNRDDTPLPDIVGLVMREHMTGEKPPAALKRAVDVWRPFI